MEFAEFLNELRPTEQAIEQAARFYLDERVGGIRLPQMKANLQDASSGAEGLQETLDLLEGQVAVREQACLALLADAWQDESQRDSIRSALEGAQKKMPVIETAIGAMVAMYGMYLLVTKGRKKTDSVVRRPDGTYERSVVEFFGPTGPLAAIAGLFHKGSGR